MGGYSPYGVPGLGEPKPSRISEKTSLAILAGVTGTILVVGALAVLWTKDTPRQAQNRRARQQLVASIPAEFDVSNISLPLTEIISTGAPKDAVEALNEPALLFAHQATYCPPSARVVGVVVAGEPRAYPISILNYHEIINDTVAGYPIAVTFSPLSDTVVVFDRRTSDGQVSLHVPGLLYNSNLLMYDLGDRGESLWSQLKCVGVSGPRAAVPLDPLPCELTTWAEWRQRHPGTRIMSAETGYDYPYELNPYDFETNSADSPPVFPASPANPLYPPKSRVLGVWTKHATRSYHISDFSADKTRVEDVLDGQRVVIEFNPQTASLRVAESGDGVRWAYSYWFAWYAFHPEAEIYSVKMEELAPDGSADSSATSAL